MENLTSYLNDHLAGAVGALEHLDHLIKSGDDKQFEAFLRSLRLEIEVDKETLKKLVDEVAEEESGVRQAGAWITEKLSRVKIGGEDSGEDEMGFFLSLEALALGIIGKQKLWAALAVAAETMPQLRGLDYAHLEARAVAQAAQVETKRLALARGVFVPAQKG